MVSILRNTYAVSDTISDLVLTRAHYPDRIFLGAIGDALDDIHHAAVDKGETLDWTTLAISTRRDNLAGGIIVATRINAS